MKLNYIYKDVCRQLVCLFFSLLVVACSADNSVLPSDPIGDPAEIRLSGVLNDINIETDTRGTGPITGTKPSNALDLNIYRADASAGTTYAATYTSNFTGTMAATTGAITMSPLQYYHADPTRNTKLIAVYPAAGTYASAGRTLTSTTVLDGGTDVMCSGLVQGNRTTAAGAMTFSHLLTQIKVNVIAQNDAAVTAWGNVTGITISGKAQNYIITLPDPSTAAVGAKATIAATGTATALSLTKADGTAASTSFTLTTASQLYGYAMFLPVTTAGTLTFNITTTNATTAQTLTTTAQTFVAGTAYEMNITFSVTGISVTASLTDWTPGNSITGTL